MTAVKDDGESHDLPPSSLKVEAHDSDASALEALHEENEVLQFLLGKTLSLKSDETSSVTSNSSSSNSYSHSQTPSDDSDMDWSGHSYNAHDRDTVGFVDGPSPELEPICESASEDDKTDGSSSPRKPNLRVRVFDSSSLFATIVRWMLAVTARSSPVRASPSLTGSPETERIDQSIVRPQEPMPQPEDGDVSTVEESTGIRQRRPSPAVSKTDLPSVPQSKDNPAEATVSQKRLNAINDHIDVVLVMVVLAVLCGYCIAIGYRFFHPVVYPLPNVDALFEPWDVSNVTARFTSPLPDSDFTGAVPIEWEIVNFPADAIREGGVEPFEYQLFLDDRRIQFEVSYWSIPNNYNESILNTTLRHRLRLRDIDGLGPHELRLEVTFPIPGSDGELRTLTDTTAFTVVEHASSEPSVMIKSPEDGTVVEMTGSYVLLLEFEAHNVHKVDVILDGISRLHMVHWKDGNLLLRGLGVGSHTITVEAFDEHSALVATQSTRIEVRGRADSERLEAGV